MNEIGGCRIDGIWLDEMSSTTAGTGSRVTIETMCIGDMMFVWAAAAAGLDPGVVVLPSGGRLDATTADELAGRWVRVPHGPTMKNFTGNRKERRRQLAEARRQARR